MSKQSRLAFAAVGLAVFALLFNLGGAGRAIADAVKYVIVANSPSNPVPTTVTNTPTVAVASLPTVTVQDRDQPARQPFQHFGSFQIQAPGIGANDSFSVPAGKRLVIEYISISSTIATGGNQIVLFKLDNQGGGSLGGFLLVPQATIENPFHNTTFIAHDQLRAYCDPGTDVTVTAIRNSSIGSDTVVYTVTGYFVDIP